MMEEKEENKELIEKREKEFKEALIRLASEARMSKDMADDLKVAIDCLAFGGYYDLRRCLERVAIDWLHEVEKPYQTYQYYRDVREMLQDLAPIIKDLGALRARKILDEVIASLPE